MASRTGPATLRRPPSGSASRTTWPSRTRCPALPRREHHVTAVVVSHDGAVWLPAVLTTLAAQTRPPDAAVGVDTGSVDASPDLLHTSFGAERTLRLDHTVGFGQAVRAGLAHLGPRTHEPFAPEVVSWVWLLHDDSAPDAHCLERLLDTADDNPSVAVLGPKVLGWHDRRLLLEAGVTVTGSGRRVTGLERREHDQGQHDGIRDVLAVSSAGMLVRRDVWEALAGFDPSLPLFRDDLDFCWRAHRMGERVMVATDAVIHHREASAHGRRADDIAPQPAPGRPRGRRPRPARPGERAGRALRRAAPAARQPRPGRRLPAGQGRRRRARRGRRGTRTGPAPVEGPVLAGAGGPHVDRAGERRAAPAAERQGPDPSGARGHHGRPDDQRGVHTRHVGQRARQRTGRRGRRLPRRHLVRTAAPRPGVSGLPHRRCPRRGRGHRHPRPVARRRCPAGRCAAAAAAGRRRPLGDLPAGLARRGPRVHDPGTAVPHGRRGRRVRAARQGAGRGHAPPAPGHPARREPAPTSPCAGSSPARRSGCGPRRPTPCCPR